MTTLSICRDLAPSDDDALVPGSAEPRWVTKAGSASKAWGNARYEDWVSIFEKGTPVRVFFAPRGVVGYYNSAHVAVTRRDDRIFGRSIRSDYVPTEEIELPHMQVDVEVTAVVGLLTQPHAPFFAPGECVYLRTAHDVRHRPCIAESLWAPAVHAGAVHTVNLYYSEAGAVTNLHYDVQSGAIQQLRGRKRVILFPPEAMNQLPMHLNHHILGRRCALDMKLTEQAVAQHPALQNVRGFECIIEPDQCL